MIQKESLISAFECYNEENSRSIVETHFSGSEYAMIWEINKNCNFKCDYCINKKDTKPPLKISNAEIISAFNITKKNWFINITGGEPFLFPGFIDLVSSLTLKKHYFY